MQLKDIARRLPEEVWTVFEPILPPVVWFGVGRAPKSNRECFHALLYVLVSGIPWEMLPLGFPSYQDRSAASQALAGTRRLPHRMAAVGRAIRATQWHQL